MKLILGQGNPETKYDGTRHNVGFSMLDVFATAHAVVWHEKSKFDALIGEALIDNEKVLLVKPTTFYNETGQSARKLIDFYSLDPVQDLLVIHDDLALPLGTIRTRKQGSDAGNNGIKSLNAHIGQDYSRIRIGIWSTLRDQMNDTEFVLGKFSQSERETLLALTPTVMNYIENFIASTLIHETSKLELA